MTSFYVTVAVAARRSGATNEVAHTTARRPPTAPTDDSDSDSADTKREEELEGVAIVASKSCMERQRGRPWKRRAHLRR